MLAYGTILLLSYCLYDMLPPTFGFQSNPKTYVSQSPQDSSPPLFVHQVTVKLPLVAEPGQNLIVISYLECFAEAHSPTWVSGISFTLCPNAPYPTLPHIAACGNVMLECTLSNINSLSSTTRLPSQTTNIG